MNISRPCKLNVTIKNDDIFEENETFYATIDPLSLPYGITLGDITSSSITILDDDGKSIHKDFGCLYLYR